MGNQITVTIPAEPGSVGVLRAVVAAAVARLGFSLDGIDDLRLAVDEACAHLLMLAPDATTLVVAVGSREGGAEIDVRVDTPGGDEGGSSITWYILSALLDDATLHRDASSVSIRMRKAVA